MADPHGTNFIGLDDEGIGDGTSDATTYPEDTDLENQLDTNTRDLVARGDRVTYMVANQPGSGGVTDERYWMSTGIGKGAYLCWIPYIVRDNLTRIRARVFAFSFIKDTTDIIGGGGVGIGEVDLSLIARDPQSGAEVEATNKIQTSDTSYQEHVVTLTPSKIDTLQVESSFIWVGLRIQSLYSVELQSDFQIERQERALVDLTDSDSHNFDSDMGVDSYINSDASIWDRTLPIHNRPEAGGNEAYAGVLEQRLNTDNDTNVFPASAPGQADRWSASRFYFRGAHFEFDYDAGESSRGYEPKRSTSMRAQRPVLGEDVARHGPNTDSVHRRPRLLSIGPEGEDAGTGWDTNHFRKWHWWDLSSSDTLDTQWLLLSENPTNVTVLFQVHFCAVIQDGQTNKPTWPSNTDDYYDSFDETAGRVKGDYTLSATQMQAGTTDWSTATSVGSRTTTIENQIGSIASPQDFSAIDAQAWWAYLPEGRRNDQSVSDFFETYREGQIYRDAIPNDVAYSSTGTASVEISGHNPGDPVRVDLDIDATGIGFPTREDFLEKQIGILMQSAWYETPEV